MSHSRVTINRVANPESIQEVLAWIRSQATNENFSYVEGTPLFAVTQDGKVIGAFTMLNLPVMQCVFESDASVFQTLRTFEHVLSGMDITGNHPLLCVTDQSPLKEYADKTMESVMDGVSFYRYE